MQMLYEHLQKTQALFKMEIAKFIDETEEDCIKQEAQHTMHLSSEWLQTNDSSTWTSLEYKLTLAHLF